MPHQQGLHRPCPPTVRVHPAKVNVATTPIERQQNLDLLNRRGPTHRGPIRHGLLLGPGHQVDRPHGEAVERHGGHPTVRAVLQGGTAQAVPLDVLEDVNNS